MGQQTTSLRTTNNRENDAEVPTAFTESRISWDAGSVFAPNGFFPPEIIIHILKHADMMTCIRSSQSCKLWYESSVQEVYKHLYIERYGVANTSESSDDNWKVKFSRRAFMDQNLAKGIWWAEALSSYHFPQMRAFSYVASFEGNKVIINNHHIFNSSNHNEKFFENAYLLDLNTMVKEPIPYGTIFANGFKLRTLACDDHDYFNWQKFEVSDGTTTRTIARKNPVPALEHFEPLYLYYYDIFVNMDGSPTVLTTNDIRHNKYDIARFLEVVDLRSGEKIAQLEISAKKILGFIGDTVIAYSNTMELKFINIFMNKWENLQFDDPEYAISVHYCKESNLLGCCLGQEGIIQFYSWPSLNLVSTLNVKQIIPPPKEYQAFDDYQIRAFAFDKSKVIVAISTQSTFYAVFDKRTSELIQTFFNTSDAQNISEGAFHLAPNGKIVTDFRNLTVYDFASPKIYQKIPVIIAEVKQPKGTTTSKIVKKRIAAVNLSKFAERQIDMVPIQHYTYFKQDTKGRRYRITGIASQPLNWKKSHAVDWSQLSDYLAAWDSENEVRNTFQLTFCNRLYQEYPHYHPFITWNRISKVLFVYERLNEQTNEWEFAEPIGLEDLLDKNTSVLEQ